jgi:DNA-binding MarR family transcriptional regulator
MHAAFFGIKRVHLRVVHITGGMLREQLLTPARFDMMRIIEMYGDEGIPQAAIQHRLGVSAPTVSRMLESLRKLGFVRRSRLARDRRCGLVTITAVGLWAVQNARENLVESGISERLALRGLAVDREEARPALATLERSLMRMRRTYGDSTPFDHPWKMQDIVPYEYHRLVDGRLVYGMTTAS